MKYIEFIYVKIHTHTHTHIHTHTYIYIYIYKGLRKTICMIFINLKDNENQLLINNN